MSSAAFTALPLEIQLDVLALLDVLSLLALLQVNRHMNRLARTTLKARHSHVSRLIRARLRTKISSPNLSINPTPVMTPRRSNAPEEINLDILNSKLESSLLSVPAPSSDDHHTAINKHIQLTVHEDEHRIPIYILLELDQRPLIRTSSLLMPIPPHTSDDSVHIPIHKYRGAHFVCNVANLGEPVDGAYGGYDFEATYRYSFDLQSAFINPNLISYLAEQSQRLDGAV